MLRDKYEVIDSTFQNNHICLNSSFLSIIPAILAFLNYFFQTFINSSGNVSSWDTVSKSTIKIVVGTSVGILKYLTHRSCNYDGVAFDRMATFSVEYEYARYSLKIQSNPLQEDSSHPY